METIQEHIEKVIKALGMFGVNKVEDIYFNFMLLGGRLFASEQE